MRITHRGFSLIEMLVYAGLVAMVAIIVVASFLPLSRLYASLALSVELNASAEVALERMIREIREAEMIREDSTLGISPGILALDTSDALGAPATMRFSLQDGAVMIEENGAVPYALTSGVEVMQLVFYGIENGASSQMVSVEMVLQATHGTLTKTLPMRASAVLRGSY